MRKLVTITLGAFLFGITSIQALAQSEVKKDAQKVGNKTAEISSKGYHSVKDKVYADKVGPDKQTIYIDKHAKYYYIDDKGRKVYVKKAELKDK